MTEAQAREERTKLLHYAGRVNALVELVGHARANAGQGTLGRALSVAVTEMETAVLWLRRAAEIIEVEPGSSHLPPVGAESVLEPPPPAGQEEIKFPEGGKW